MAESDTLLAYLVPKLNPQVEVAATKALSYILNKSCSARAAFNHFVSEVTASSMAPVALFVAEATYVTEDKKEGRPDLLGYDSNGEHRVIVEAKFGANLLEGQGGGYLNQLSDKGETALIFLVPSSRIEYLWDEVKRDVETANSKTSLLDKDASTEMRLSRISHPEGYLIMVSWRELLSYISQNSNGESAVQEDLRQLEGLAEAMDKEVFHPLEKGDLGSNLARRLLNLTMLVDTVVDGKGVKENWLSVSGYRATATSDGCVRYFKLCDSGIEAWFGLSYENWNKYEGMPLWFKLTTGEANKEMTEQKAMRLRLRLANDFAVSESGAIAIQIQEGLAFRSMVEKVVEQMKDIETHIKVIREES